MNEKLKIILAFYISIVVLSIVGIYSYKSTNSYRNASEWITHTQTVMSETEVILFDILHAESAERGYVITGDVKLLKSFNGDSEKLENTYLKIKDLTKDNPAQQVLLDSLYHAVNLEYAFLKHINSVSQIQRSESAMQRIKSGQGVILMDNVKRLIDRFINNEKKLLTERLYTANKQFSTTIIVIVVSIILSIVIVLIALLLFIKDYNKRMRLEKTLVEYKHFFNNSANFACIVNAQGYFEVINPNFEKILGYTESELFESQFLSFIHPDDIDLTLKGIEKLQSGAITINFVNRYRKKDGNYLWFDWNTTPNPAIGKFYAKARDITERKKAEAEKERLLNILQKSLNEVYVFNADTLQFEYVNEGALRNLGYSMEEMSAMKAYDINPELTMAKFNELIAPLINHEKEKIVFETIHERADSSLYPVEIHLQLTTQAEQSVFLAIVLDITERKNAEAKIQRVFERYDILARATSDTIWDWDIVKNRMQYNEGITEMFGYELEEIDRVADWWENNIHPADLPVVSASIDKAFDKKIETIQMEYRYRCANNSYKHIHDRAFVMYDETGKPIRMIGAMQDVTERKKAEEELRMIHQQLSQHLDNSPLAVIEWDKNSIIRDWSPQAENIFGWSKAEVLNKHFNKFNFVPEEDAPAVGIITQELMSGAVIHDKSSNRNKTKSGNIIHSEWFNSVLKDDEGNVSSILSLVLDVTEQKKLQENLIAATKIAEESVKLKDTFLANMSHEIRTPMNAIIGFTDILLRKNLPEQEMDYLQSIKTAGDNLLTIINDILDISKMEAGMIVFEEHELNINGIFKSLNQMLLPQAEDKKIDLIFIDKDDVPEIVLGDNIRLCQIIINLVGNAIKFTTTGSVNVSAKTLKKENDRTFIEFSIKDTGIGIPENKLEHIFERFRQADSDTTRTFGGTGLGLSIAKQLVELQGGTLSVASKVGVGSVFSFTIPFKEYTQQITPTKNIEKKYKIEELQKLKILLVEDNPLNVKLVLSLFSEYGLKAEVAENGKMAVEKIKASNGSTPLTTRFDIVLMDMEMPVMNGYEATQIIRDELKNPIPIIAMTAHAMTGIKEKCLSMGMNDYISKPINWKLLFEKLSEHSQLGSTTEAAATSNEKIVNFAYLSDLTGGKKEIMKDIIDLFLKQLPEEMLVLNEAIKNTDYVSIKDTAHKMKSSVAVFGIDILGDPLQEMEDLAAMATDIEKIRQLNQTLNVLSKQVVDEIEIEKLKLQ